MKLKSIGLAGLVVGSALLLTGCPDDADVASRNLSKAADNFEINRRVVFYNGITGAQIAVYEGACSIKADMADKQLELTCKVGHQQFVKHFLGLSDNVSYFAEQMFAEDVNVNHYRRTFKPQAILPDIDFRGSASDLVRNAGAQ